LLKNDNLKARDLFKIAVLIRPEAAWPHYLVALATARMGDSKGALQALKRAAERGLSGPRLLEDHGFDKLRSDDSFQEISTRVAKNAAAAQP
jgi:hypothetical protein